MPSEKMRMSDRLEIELEPVKVTESTQVDTIEIPKRIAENLFRLCLEVQVLAEQGSQFAVNLDLMLDASKEYLCYYVKRERKESKNATN